MNLKEFQKKYHIRRIDFENVNHQVLKKNMQVTN